MAIVNGTVLGYFPSTQLTELTNNIAHYFLFARPYNNLEVEFVFDIEEAEQMNARSIEAIGQELVDYNYFRHYARPE